MLVRGIASKQSLDLQGCLIVAGAFDASIKRRGLHRIDLLVSHDDRRKAGSIFKLETIDNALHLWAIVNEALPYVADLLKSLGKDEQLGLSIAARDVRGIQVGLRQVVVEADLQEVSLTKHPVNPECLVTFISRTDIGFPAEWQEAFDEQERGYAEHVRAGTDRKIIPTIRYPENV